MAKNTGMNAKDDKEGKTAGLPPVKAKALNKHLQEEKNEPAPTKTIAAIRGKNHS